MPRLSLWRPNHSNDYKFFDRTILEQFTVGATDIHVHKYIGPIDQGGTLTTTSAQVSTGTVLEFANTSAVLPGMYVSSNYITSGTTVLSKTATTVTLSASTLSAVPVGTTISFYSDATKPSYVDQSPLNIQDLLFLENRDRKYDADVYVLRGYYRVNDNDFDLTQFGLFLTGDTIFLTVHLNDMVEKLGRKLMVGDVIELPHLKDFYPLDDSIEAALKRYYVVQDATKSAEGFSPTWWPHLWRVKLQPLVDSQEYKDILNIIKANENTDSTIGELLSTYDKFIDVNDAIIEQAEQDVPASGYDTTFIYTEPTTESGYPGDPGGLDSSSVTEDASESVLDTTAGTTAPATKVQGYLTGDGQLPNGATVAAGISFPSGATVGDWYLRLDYLPNRLFRFNGSRWVKIEDNVRTNLTPGANNTTQRSSFVNNTGVRYQGALGWDAIRVANPYTPLANAHTVSFTLSNTSPYGTVVTKTSYVSTYGVKTTLNGTIITNTMSNSSGNIAFTISNTLSIDDLIEYTVYETVIREKQSLSDALRPTADN